MREMFRCWDRVEKKIKPVTELNFLEWYVGTGYNEGERNSFENLKTDRHLLMRNTGIKLDDKYLFENDILRSTLNYNIFCIRFINSSFQLISMTDNRVIFLNDAILENYINKGILFVNIADIDCRINYNKLSDKLKLTEGEKEELEHPEIYAKYNKNKEKTVSISDISPQFNPRFKLDEAFSKSETEEKIIAGNDSVSIYKSDSVKEDSKLPHLLEWEPMTLSSLSLAICKEEKSSHPDKEKLKRWKDKLKKLINCEDIIALENAKIKAKEDHYDYEFYNKGVCLDQKSNIKEESIIKNEDIRLFIISKVSYHEDPDNDTLSYAKKVKNLVISANRDQILFAAVPKFVNREFINKVIKINFGSIANDIKDKSLYIKVEEISDFPTMVLKGSYCFHTFKEGLLSEFK